MNEKVKLIQEAVGSSIDGAYGKQTATAVAKIFGINAEGNLEQLTKKIQEHVGVSVDGDFGNKTATAVLEKLNKTAILPPTPTKVDSVDFDGIDDRSKEKLAKLDPKSLAYFIPFIKHAKKVAATFGVEYKIVQGTRTFAEQAALYAKGRTTAGPKVTNAPPGTSWHNYGIAIDMGCFRDGKYLDDTEPNSADKVHRAVGAIAAEHNIRWGGLWKTFKDIPHFQVGALPDSPNNALKDKFLKTGSVL